MWGQEALLLPPQLLLVVVHNHSTAGDPFLFFHSLLVHFIRFYAENFQLLCVCMYRYRHVIHIYIYKNWSIFQRQTFLYKIHISSKEKVVDIKSRKDSTEILLQPFSCQYMKQHNLQSYLNSLSILRNYQLLIPCKSQTLASWCLIYCT